MTRNGKPTFPRRSPRTKVLTVAIATVCVAVLFAALLGAFVLRHPSMPAIRADLAIVAERKLQQARHAEDTESRTVALTEDEVNSILHARLQKAGSLAPPGVDGLHDLRVRLHGDRIKAFIIASRRGTNITLELEGKLYTQRRQLQFELTSGAIGLLRLPTGVLVEAMQEALNRLQERQKLQLPGDIADLRVANSKVLLRYE